MQGIFLNAKKSKIYFKILEIKKLGFRRYIFARVILIFDISAVKNWQN